MSDEARKVAEVFGRSAPSYDSVIPFFATFGNRLVELADLASGTRLLDAGCGRGAAQANRLKCTSGPRARFVTGLLTFRARVGGASRRVRGCIGLHRAGAKSGATENYKLVTVAPACKPMTMPASAPSLASGTLEAAATRVAALLAGTGAGLSDRTLTSLEFETMVSPRSLERTTPPADSWAVDGGQALVADARCLQVVATRASRVRFQNGSCTLEEEGELRAQVLAGAEERAAAIVALAVADMSDDTAIDVNLLRDRWEWDAVERSIEEADAGGLVLVDGDLLPDWRIPIGFLGRILTRAAERGVVVAGITKHSSLSRGGAPLVGQLEVEAAERLGPRALWWAPVAHSKINVDCDRSAALQVVAARLDPDARFAFRIDLPAGADPAAALGAISALCDDAAFPGYPYPLTVADRLAACPGWVRQETGLRLDELLAEAGIAHEVRERAFSDRHRLMERA